MPPLNKEKTEKIKSLMSHLEQIIQLLKEDSELYDNKKLKITDDRWIQYLQSHLNNFQNCLSPSYSYERSPFSRIMIDFLNLMSGGMGHPINDRVIYQRKDIDTKTFQQKNDEWDNARNLVHRTARELI